ncbi:MAG: ABC transporter ATP-binding protein, partial [Huintestinicola sp.]
MSEKKLNKSDLKKVMSYVKPYKVRMALSVIMAAAVVIMTLYVPILIGRAIDLIPEAAESGSFDGIVKLLFTAGIIAAVTALVQWLMNTVNNHITYSVVRDMRDAAFKRIEILPLSYLDRHQPGEIVNRVIADADQFSDGLLMGFTQLFTGAMTILCTLVFMLSISWKMSLVVILLTPLSLFIAKFISTHTYDMFKLQSETRGEQTAFIDEMISGQKVVKAFGREEKALEKFDEINERLRSCSLRATFFSSLTNPSTRFVNNVVYAGVALAGALSCISAESAITIGALTCFLSYVNQYTKPFNEISGVITELQ